MENLEASRDEASAQLCRQVRNRRLFIGGVYMSFRHFITAAVALGAGAIAALGQAGAADLPVGATAACSDAPGNISAISTAATRMRPRRKKTDSGASPADTIANASPYPKHLKLYHTSPPRQSPQRPTGSDRPVFPPCPGLQPPNPLLYRLLPLTCARSQE